MPENNRHLLSISDLNEAARDLLEGHFNQLWVTGEISNLSQPSSGHVYLTLKDTHSQLRTALFRGNRLRSATPLRNGMQVNARGRLSLYTPRGDYQLIIDTIEEAGSGALHRAYELLKTRLRAEGLMDLARKRPLPEHPVRLAVITSPTGAALRDILNVLRRRAPSLAITLLPVPVQGKESAPALVQALRTANDSRLFDLVLLARGGGSLEDLWSFNEESVARAIAASQLPVITGIGHETDFTIADLVADVRAPTPSAAAELLSGDQEQQRKQLHGLLILMQDAMSQHLQRKHHKLELTRLRLRHPSQRLQQHQQRLDDLERQLHQSLQRRLLRAHHTLQLQQQKLQAISPKQHIILQHNNVQLLKQRLCHHMRTQLAQHQHQTNTVTAQLHSLSPLATLARGYAITKDAQGHVLYDSTTVHAGEAIVIQLHKGKLDATVTETHPTGTPSTGTRA